MIFISFLLSKKSKLARLLLPPLPLQQARFLAAAKPAHKFLALLVHAKPLTEEAEGSCSNHRCAVSWQGSNAFSLIRAFLHAEFKVLSKLRARERRESLAKGMFGFLTAKASGA